jgi:hypothetical protein
MSLIYKVPRYWFGQNRPSTKDKNVVIGEERHKRLDNKIWSRKVVLEKAADGKETLKITSKASKLGRQDNGSRRDQRHVQ